MHKKLMKIDNKRLPVSGTKHKATTVGLHV